MKGPHCKRHRQPAGWQCQGCKANLCPDCVAVKRVQAATELDVCLECGELADTIMVHRAEHRGYAARLPAALIWPISKAGFIAMAGMGLLRALLSYAPGLGSLLSACALAAVCFGIIRSSARGSDDFDVTDFSSLSDIVVPGLKTLAAASVIWVPVSSWIWLRWSHVESPFAFLSDPVLWLMLLTGAAYAPMAIMVGAAGNSLVSMLNPGFVVRHALKLGGDYGIAVLTLCLLFVPWLVFFALGTMLDMLPVPFIPRIIDYTLASFVPFVAARVLGLLLLVRGDQVGYGMPGDYLEPALVGVAPRGLLPEPEAPEQPKVDRYAPIELEPEPAAPSFAVAAAEPARPRLTELDPSTLPELPENEES